MIRPQVQLVIIVLATQLSERLGADSAPAARRMIRRHAAPGPVVIEVNATEPVVRTGPVRP